MQTSSNHFNNVCVATCYECDKKINLEYYYIDNIYLVHIT